jgi:hypothetical protein
MRSEGQTMLAGNWEGDAGQFLRKRDGDGRYE